MKEEEAKTKWCPHARYAPNNEVAYIANRYDAKPLDDMCKCIASDCMMWVQTDNEGSPTNAEYDESSNAGYFPAGHCGLARKA